MATTKATTRQIKFDSLDMSTVQSKTTVGVLIFSRKFGDKSMLVEKNADGRERRLQTSIGSGRMHLIQWSGSGGTAGLTIFNLGNNIQGTLTSRLPAAGGYFLQRPRHGYVSTSAAAGLMVGWRNDQLYFWRGNADGLGGFYAIFVFGSSSAATVANQRSFAGFANTVNGLGNVDPSTLFNMFGVANDSADSNMQFMHNDASGTATKVDLGSNFPAKTLSEDMYELILYAKPNGSTISLLLIRKNTGHMAELTINTNIPANTLFLSPQIQMGNGATPLAVAVDIEKVYVETE